MNKLLKYLSETGDTQVQNAALKKENICTTLHFISVLITSIDYSGDQNDGEMESMSNTSEVVGDSPLEESILLFILALLCPS